MTINYFAKSARIAGAGMVLALLGACNMQTTGFGPFGAQQSVAQQESAGFRQARFAEVSAMRAWRVCRDDAVELDSQARRSGIAARYLASAKLLEKCEADVGTNAAKVARDERFRAQALAVQNYMKGGDVSAARRSLDDMRTTHPDQDLYYPDGASFTETMEILLGLKDRTAVGAFSVANVSREVKAELRRARYWTRN